MNNVSYADEIYKSMMMSGEYVLIKKITLDDLKKIDGIYIPESEKNKNTKIGTGQVLDVSSEAKRKYSVYPGDYVLYDYYSANGDWNDSIITKGENLIVKMSEDEFYKFLGK